MAAVNGSSLYGGSVSTAAIYQITQGVGFQWKDFVKTEIRVDGKPRQLTRGIHAANPLKASVKNPRMAADYSSTPSVTIDGRELSLVKLMYTNKMSPEEFMDTFPEYQPTGTAIDLAMSPAIQSVVFDLGMNAIKTQLNNLHAIGDDTLSSDPLEWYNGFVTLIRDDSDTTQVGTPVVLTSSNILSEVEELIQAVPSRLRMKSNLVTFCSVADYDLYQSARAKTQMYTPETDVTSNEYRIQSFGERIKLVPIESIPKNFLFTTLADTTDMSNLVQGVWVEADADVLRMYKEVETDEDWLILMKFYIGIQYKSGSDIFFKYSAAKP